MSDPSRSPGAALPLLPTARRGAQPFAGVPMRLVPPAAARIRSAPTVSSTGGTRLATASLVLGILSLLVNLLLLPSLLAIVLGGIGLARGTAARRRAIVGVVLGGFGVVALIVEAAVLIPVFHAVQRAAVAHVVEATIQNDAANQGVALAAVHCDEPSVVVAGADLACTATTSAGTRVDVRAVLLDTAGRVSYRVTGTT